MQMKTFEERMWESEVRQCRHKIWHLDSRCFNLELDWSRLQWKWPGRTPEEQRYLRRRKAELQHETRMIRIELEHLRRQAEPLMDAPS
jgi:hypothetical protein